MGIQFIVESLFHACLLFFCLGKERGDRVGEHSTISISLILLFDLQKQPQCCLIYFKLSHLLQFIQKFFDMLLEVFIWLFQAVHLFLHSGNLFREEIRTLYKFLVPSPVYFGKYLSHCFKLKNKNEPQSCWKNIKGYSKTVIKVMVLFNQVVQFLRNNNSVITLPPPFCSPDCIWAPGFHCLSP